MEHGEGQEAFGAPVSISRERGKVTASRGCRVTEGQELWAQGWGGTHRMHALG